jgi:hypothetical protein
MTTSRTRPAKEGQGGRGLLPGPRPRGPSYLRRLGPTTRPRTCCSASSSSHGTAATASTRPQPRGLGVRHRQQAGHRSPASAPPCPRSHRAGPRPADADGRRPPTAWSGPGRYAAAWAGSRPSRRSCGSNAARCRRSRPSNRPGDGGCTGWPTVAPGRRPRLPRTAPRGAAWGARSVLGLVRQLRLAPLTAGRWATTSGAGRLGGAGCDGQHPARFLGRG